MKRQKNKGSCQELQVEEYGGEVERGIRDYFPERYSLPAGYSLFPSQQTLFFNQGICDRLVITSQHGSVEWKGNINLSTLAQPLSQTIRIAHLDIQVYLDNCGKPPIGKELNRPCMATFNINKQAQPETLVKICRNNNTAFVRLNVEQGQFKVLIPHFTRYSFNEDIQGQNKLKRNPRNNQIRRNQDMDEQTSRQQRNVYVVNEELNRKSIQMSQESKQSTVQVKNGLEQSRLNKMEDSDYEDYIHPNIQDRIRKNKDITTRSNIKQQKQSKIKEISCLQISIEDKKTLNLERNSFYKLFIERKPLDALNLANIIAQQQISFQVKRFLTLYSILFHDKIYFQINRNNLQENYQLTPASQLMNSQGSRQQRLKSWFAWVIAHDYQKQMETDTIFISNKDKVLKALALRKPELALDYLYINNRVLEAEVICNLQDLAFRQNCQRVIPKDNQYKYSKEIRNILFNNGQENIISSEWLINFAFKIWYHNNKTDYLHNLMEAVDELDLDNVQNHTQQLRLIQIFLKSKGLNLKNQLFGGNKIKIPSQEHICMYMISNELDLHQYEQKFYTTKSNNKSKHLYEKYRYKILLKMLNLLKGHNINTLIGLVEKDKGIYSKEKEIILRELYEQKLERQSKNYSEEEMSIELRANQMIQNGKQFEALALLFKIPQWTSKIYKKICKMATNSHLLIHYNRENNRKLMLLLGEKKQEFQDLIIILISRTRLLNRVQLSRLVEMLQGKSIFCEYFDDKIESYLLHALQKNVSNALIIQNQVFKELSSNKALLKQVKRFLHSRIQFLQKIQQSLTI